MSPKRSKVLRAREARAWAMRSRGWSQIRIATELGIGQPSVSKLLGRVEARELKRMSKSVERVKVTQHSQLEHVIEEALDAWHRSKTPRKRAARKTVGGMPPMPHGDDDDPAHISVPDTVETSEIIERDGDTGYLYAAMTAMGNIRSLWGLDVAPALQEPASSIASLTADLFARASSYEQRSATTQASEAGNTAGAAPAPEGGASEVPDGPEPIQ